MGWKNIRDHYRITHIIQVNSRGEIEIGSAYVHDLMTIAKDMTVRWGNLGPSANDNLARYYQEMTGDINTLARLFNTPDTFQKSLSVWTYEGAEIIEKQCEEYGWPNLTHDGLLMYSDTFSPSKEKIVDSAKKSAELGVKYATERVDRIKQELAEAEEEMRHRAEVKEKLDRDYPKVRP